MDPPRRHTPLLWRSTRCTILRDFNIVVAYRRHPPAGLPLAHPARLTCSAFRSRAGGRIYDPARLRSEYIPTCQPTISSGAGLLLVARARHPPRHASNLRAGTVIVIWDRLFGTYRRAFEPSSMVATTRRIYQSGRRCATCGRRGSGMAANLWRAKRGAGYRPSSAERKCRRARLAEALRRRRLTTGGAPTRAGGRADGDGSAAPYRGCRGRGGSERCRSRATELPGQRRRRRLCICAAGRARTTGAGDARCRPAGEDGFAANALAAGEAGGSVSSWSRRRRTPSIA